MAQSCRGLHPFLLGVPGWCAIFRRFKMNVNPNALMAGVAGLVVLADQGTKGIVLDKLEYGTEHPLLDGFFKFVHWGNSGAAWSMFHGNNELLAIVSLLALMFIFLFRSQFEIRHRAGQVAMGLVFGGIIGNLYDRLFRNHVIDFIYFHLHPRGGREIGFPAFNIADAAICTGVGLLFLVAYITETQSRKASTPVRPRGA